ncbi:MAG: PD-(D/E)XK nuclease family protein [Oscillospiraceae bacterium]|jgi:ATP-dependent helicase/nuclease subunit B|nr:PD-(D/E)XK nuclease family protein [Oscillospiraceae bacterium]
MIRLIIGCAGSGKTSRVAEELRARAEKGDSRLTLVVPEQYSHAAERQLLEVVGDSLSLHGEVLSFKRLSSRVAEELGAPGTTLDGGGMLLTLHRALSAVSDRLEVYGGSDRRAQFLESLLYTVVELKNSAVTPESLLDASERADGALAAKLRDLSLILASFDAHIPDGVTDPGGALGRLADTIRESSYAKSALYFDGFNDFTEPELRVILALIDAGAELTFCLTAPDLYGDDEVFRLSRDTAERIITAALESGEKYEIIEMPGGAATFGENRAVELFRAPDMITECEYAAAKVLELARAGLRWRDIAVMSRDDGYPELCESVFERAGIPVFRGGREDLLEKPPAKLITAALDIVSSNWEYGDVFAYLKTNLTCLRPHELDALEGFVIRRGIRGSVWMRSAPWRGADESIDNARRAVAEPLARLSQTLKTSRTGGDMLRALYAFLEEIRLPDTIQNRSRELAERGFDRLADEYAQLWEIIVRALDQMFLATENAPMSVAEFSRLLPLLLSCYDVGVIPVSLDRVTLGDMAMSRRRDVRALIVLGATDANLPKIASQTGVLSESERDEMIAALGVALRDGSEQLLYREMNVIYSALTLPSEKLIVMYPETPGAQPSYVVSRLTTAHGVSPRRMEPSEYRSSALVPHSEYAAVSDSAPGRGTLSPAVSEKLYGETPRLSATRVESFSSCKFAFFMRSALRARALEPIVFDAPEAGTFTHFVLERVSAAARDSGGFKNLEEERVRELTRRFTLEYLEANYPDFEERSERFRYLFRRLARDTERVTLDLKRELSRSDFSPIEFEAPVDVSVPGGLEVTGFIDRVDGWERDGRLYFRVSDYKTGRKSFSLSDVYNGLGMQLLIYIYALGRAPGGSDTVPAAALYTPARDELYSAQHDEPDEKIAAELAKKLKRRGLLLDDPAVIDAMENGEEKLYLPVKVTSSGYSGDSLVTSGQLAKLLAHVESHLQSIAGEMKGGEIAADPYRRREDDTACVYCDYRAACAFGSLPGDEYRELPNLPASAVWEKLGGDAV